MNKEGVPVFRGLAGEGSAGVSVVAIGDLHLIGDERRRAREPLHRPGAPAEGHAVRRQELPVERPADGRGISRLLAAEIRVRIAFERLEQRAEIVARQIGVHNGDGAGCADPLSQRGDGLAHGNERIVSFGAAVIGDDDRLWRRRDRHGLSRLAKERDGGGQTRSLDARTSIIGAVAFHRRRRVALRFAIGHASAFLFSRKSLRVMRNFSRDDERSSRAFRDKRALSGNFIAGCETACSTYACEGSMTCSITWTHQELAVLVVNIRMSRKMAPKRKKTPATSRLGFDEAQLREDYRAQHALFGTLKERTYMLFSMVLYVKSDIKIYAIEKRVKDL